MVDLADSFFEGVKISLRGVYSIQKLTDLQRSFDSDGQEKMSRYA